MVEIIEILYYRDISKCVNIMQSLSVQLTNLTDFNRRLNASLRFSNYSLWSVLIIELNQTGLLIPFFILPEFVFY